MYTLQLKLEQLDDMLRFPEHNPSLVNLTSRIHDCKSELQSEQNRLAYAAKKLKIAQEAYKHAQSVYEPGKKPATQQRVYDLRRSIQS